MHRLKKGPVEDHLAEIFKGNSRLDETVLQIYAEHFAQRCSADLYRAFSAKMFCRFMLSIFHKEMKEIIVKSFVQSNGVANILIIYNQNNEQTIIIKN